MRMAFRTESRIDRSLERQSMSIPATCTIAFTGSRPGPVSTAPPSGMGPCRPTSRKGAYPARRLMAPETPCGSRSHHGITLRFQALTIASTGWSSRSPSTISSCMGGAVRGSGGRRTMRPRPAERQPLAPRAPPRYDFRPRGRRPGTPLPHGTMSTKRTIGAHTIDNGGIHMAARRAGAAGMDALQMFTAPPRFYGDRSGIKPDRVERFQAALKEARIEPRNVVVHAAYVLGVATADEEKWARAAGGLAKELERSTALGVGAVCFHPGSATDGDRAAAEARVAKAITAALEKVEGGTRLLVENTAGAGQTMGRTAAEVAGILRHVPDRLRERTGYGLDTCHLFASGYDIRASKEGLKGILDEFEEAAGERPGFFHLNDSEGALGSNKDRHLLLGEGQIGVEAFRWLLQDPRSAGIPLILETPQENPEVGDEDPTPDPWDVRMVELLRSFTK